MTIFSKLSSQCIAMHHYVPTSYIQLAPGLYKQHCSRKLAKCLEQ